MTALRYNYMPTVPAVGSTALVWYYTEEVKACWTGQWWVDGQGRILPDVLCWRVG